jgi:predicted nucleic acid-binding protein
VKVACNASPLIWLSHTGRFALLHELFEGVLIPPEVRAETVERAMGYPNAETVRVACEAGWMVVVPPNDAARVTVLRAQLHAGEAETLVMAAEQGVDAVLVDDLRARNFAMVMGLRVIGTAGILLLAHDQGMSVDVKSTLDAMRSRGFRLADSVYQAILQRIGDENT